MAEEIQLRIVTPRRPVLDEPVLEVTAPGTAGEFGVLPDHAAFLSSLEVGRLTYKTARGTRHLAVRGGFAEVADNVMTVLADAAEAPEEIDPDAAERDLRTAEQQMQETSPIEPAYSEADSERRWALTRLELARAR